MKQTLWLHIGPHKTGTTSIQNALDGYDDGATRYARLGLPNHSIALTCAFGIDLKDNATLGRFGIPFEEAGDIGADVRQVLAEELSTPGHTLILSGEGMSVFGPQDFGALADFVRPFVHRTRVLAYARDPLSRLSSMVQQVVRVGTLDLATLSLSYRSQLEAALTTFGKDNMAVKRFDTSLFPGGSPVADFCQSVGADPTGREDVHARTGVSRDVIGLLHRWNQTEAAVQGSTERFRARTRLINVLSRTFPGRFRLAPAYARSLLPPDDLEWLRDEIGIDFTGALDGAEDLAGDVGSIDDLGLVSAETHKRLAALARNRGVPPGDGSIEAIMSALFQQILARVEQLDRQK